jgi:hypothetical protein
VRPLVLVLAVVPVLAFVSMLIRMSKALLVVRLEWLQHLQQSP